MARLLERIVYEAPIASIPEEGPVPGVLLALRDDILSHRIPSLEKRVIDPFENALKNRALKRGHTERGSVGDYHYLIAVQSHPGSPSYTGALNGLDQIFGYLESSIAGGETSSEAFAYRDRTFVAATTLLRELDRLSRPGEPKQKATLEWKSSDEKNAATLEPDASIERVACYLEPERNARLTEANAATVHAARGLRERLSEWADAVKQRVLDHYVTVDDEARAERADRSVVIELDGGWYCEIAPRSSPRTITPKALYMSFAGTDEKSLKGPGTGDLRILESLSLDHAPAPFSDRVSVSTKPLRTPGHGWVSIERDGLHTAYRVIERDGRIYVSEPSVRAAIAKRKSLSFGRTATRIATEFHHAA